MKITEENENQIKKWTSDARNTWFLYMKQKLYFQSCLFPARQNFEENKIIDQRRLAQRR
jgi:hypothetical protein